MSTEYVLAIDSSTSVGWVSLARIEDGTKVEILSEHSIKAFSHAESLLPGIHMVLRENGLSARMLQLLIFGDGPGSFTGLRIGASVISGLAFGISGRVVAVASHAGIACAYAQSAGQLAGGAARLKVSVFSDGGDTMAASTFQITHTTNELFCCELLGLMEAVDPASLVHSTDTIKLGTEELWKGRFPIFGIEEMVRPDTLPISSGLILALYGGGDTGTFAEGQLQARRHRFVSDATNGCDIRYGQPVKAMTLVQRRGW